MPGVGLKTGKRQQRRTILLLPILQEEPRGPADLIDAVGLVQRRGVQVVLAVIADALVRCQHAIQLRHRDRVLPHAHGGTRVRPRLPDVVARDLEKIGHLAAGGEEGRYVLGPRAGSVVNHQGVDTLGPKPPGVQTIGPQARLRHQDRHRKYREQKTGFH